MTNDKKTDAVAEAGQIRLEYGDSFIETPTPPNLIQVVKPAEVPVIEDAPAAYLQALQNPIDSPPLRELAKPDMKIAIVVSDNARKYPRGEMLAAVLDEISHVPDENITIVVANGNHDPEPIESLGLPEGVAERIRIHNHEFEDRDYLEYIGDCPSPHRVFYLKAFLYESAAYVWTLPIRLWRTVKALLQGSPRKAFFHFATRGPLWPLLLAVASLNTKVLVSKFVAQADLRILIGQIKPHFFAGFGGGMKSLVPGVAGKDTITRNHFMMSHPLCRLGKVDGNPVRDDLQNAAKMCGPSFILNVVLNEQKKVVGVVAGDMITAHRKGMALCRAIGEVQVKRSDIVIASTGLPEAINLYQLTKILAPAAACVNPGGVIILAGSCERGTGSAVVTNEIIYQLNISQIIGKRVSLYLVSDMPAKSVGIAFITPVSSVDEGVALAKKKIGSHATSTVMQGAGLLLPQVTE